MLNSSMNQGWESFERMVIPDDAGSIQRLESWRKEGERFVAVMNMGRA